MYMAVPGLRFDKGDLLFFVLAFKLLAAACMV